VAKSDNVEKDTEWADIIIFDDTLGQGEKVPAFLGTRELRWLAWCVSFGLLNGWQGGKRFQTVRVVNIDDNFR